MGIEILIAVVGLGVFAILMLRPSRSETSPSSTPVKNSKVAVGSTGICTKCLYYTPKDKKVEFYATYELEVIGISETKLKVKVLDYSSGYSPAYEKSNRDWIIKIVDNGWVYRSEFELATIDNTQESRDKKINDILK